MQLSIEDTVVVSNTCPYCRTKHPFLPIVNGLSKTKIKPGIHYSFADNVPEYTIIKCQHILTRVCKGELCNKNPQLGFTYCRVHNKVNLIHKKTLQNHKTQTMSEDPYPPIYDTDDRSRQESDQDSCYI